MRARYCRSRRDVLRLAVFSGGLGLVQASRPACAATAMAAEPFPEGVTLLVAGTRGSPLDRWADLFAPLLAKRLPPRTRLFKQNAIGEDGVTGANQFAVRAAPDGATVLLVPGAAARAWLVGDSRVHFDTASWTPVMAGVSPAIAVGHDTVSSLRSRRVLRVAASDPTGPELPVLLGLDLMGVNLAAVFGLGAPEQARRALVAEAVDLILLHGEDVLGRLQTLVNATTHPLFSLGCPDAAGHWQRDPLAPDVPSFGEIFRREHGRLPDGQLTVAWRAAATATRLDFALVLPQLTSPDVVGLWRKIGEGLADAAQVRGLAAGDGLGVKSGAAANASTAAVAVDAPALLALRSWLDRRFGWRRS